MYARVISVNTHQYSNYKLNSIVKVTKVDTWKSESSLGFFHFIYPRLITSSYSGIEDSNHLNGGMWRLYPETLGESLLLCVLFGRLVK